MLPILTTILSALSPVIQNVFPDKDKQLEVERQIQLQLLQHMGNIQNAASEVVKAEIQGESWLQKSWRPLVMLSFAGSVMGYWFGLVPNLPDVAVSSMFDLLQMGLTGYIVGRSAEKITTTLTGNGVVDNVLNSWKSNNGIR